MIASVDDDGSGMIEFPEFLGIIKNSDGNTKTAKINEFFQNMTNGKLTKQQEVSFNLLVQKMRREHMMNAIFPADPKDPNKRENGERILKNVSKQLTGKALPIGKSQSKSTISGTASKMGFK